MARPHILIILRNPKQIKSKLHFLKLALVSGGLNQVIKKLKQSTSIDFMTMSVNTDKLVLELMQQLVSSPRKINVVELLSAKKVTVVIPVYRGFNETRRCIESAIQNTNIASHEIILINDCSPEPQIKNLLHSYTNKHPHIHVVTNNENLGFVKTVNIGMKLAGNADVILLNSDTVVANNWLDKLINQAYINDNIGTVTPFSNNATICSYPDIDGWVAIPDGEDVSSLDKACKIANEGRYIEIPTAVGFCMYIKRSCLKDVGFFDEKSFGKGYGEENDFCLRAIKKGWKHILATDIFVFHAGEVSFSKSAEEKKLNAMNVLRARYPYYERIVNAHVIKNEAYSNRLAITAARYRMDNRSVVLFITHRYSGGTEKHIQEIADAISVNNARVLILRPANEENGCDVLLEAHCKNDKLKLYLTSKNLELLAGVLKFFGLNKVHVHHVIGYRFDIEELVYLVGAPYDVTIHDFYFICPRINLITPGSGFCGTPSVSDCNACLTMEPKIGESVEIIWWRVKYGSLLNGASSVYCPSKDVADRIIEHLPLVKIHVVPHEVYHLPEIRKGFSKREIKRFAILGVLAEHKGLSLVESALVEINKKNLPIEFVLIGYPEKHLKENKYFRSTGKYNDVDLASLIDDVDPDAILFPVCWPETYSYTLTTALLSGRPIVAPSIGAFSERLQGVSNGYIYPVNLSSSQLVSFLLSLLISNFEEKVDCSNNQLFFPKPFKVVNTFYSSPEYILFEGPSEIESPIVKSKPTLLIIPEFSGSFLSPCSYIRILEIIATPTFKKEFNIRLASIKSAEEISADIVLINRVPTSNISELDSLLSHLRRTGAKLVYDIDDELLNLPDTHSEFTVYKERQNVIRRLLFEADSVWTSTEALANSFKPIARNIHIFENYLDYKLFDQLDADIQSTPDDIFNILYMGTSTHAADLDLVLDALRKLDEDGMKFNLYLIGITTNIPLFDWVKVINPPVTVYPLFRQWLLTLDFFDLGIAPLQLGDFNNCKSDIKFWDYTSMGIPTLASEVTAYRSIIVNGENGFLTKNHTEDWYIKIKEIMKNRPKLKSILIRARETLKSMHIQIDGVEKRKKVLTELLWQD